MGCGDVSHVQSVRLQTADLSEKALTTSQLQILTKLANSSSTNFGKTTVYRTPQLWKGMEVKGTWQNLVADENQNWTAASYGLVNEKELPAKVAELNKSELIAKALLPRKEQFQILPHAKQVLVGGMWSYKPRIQVDLMASDESQVYEAIIAPTGRLVSLRPKGFELESGLARIFPGNPNQTSLTNAEVKNLTGDGHLSNPWLVLQSAINELPFDKNNVFLFRPDEMVFSAVQAYYFASSAMDWFQKQLQLELKKELSVKVHVGTTPKSNVAFYYNNQVRLGEGDGILYQGMSRDPTIVMHEVSHAYVEMLSGLPFDGEGGSYSEAFADFFTAVQLDNPNMGNYAFKKGPFKRSLENDLRADKDFKNSVYGDSQIISGTFWDLTKALPSPLSEKIAVDFLIRLGPGGKFKDFTKVLEDSLHSQGLSPAQIQSVHNVLEKRGWKKQDGNWP